MSCTKCGTSNTSCGCKDTPYTTPMPVNCQPDPSCPTPSKCSEYIDASCVYLQDGIHDADLPPLTSVEEAIQQLTLMITNPECTNTDSCNCPGGGTTYNGDEGVYKDTSVTPNAFTLGAPSGSQSTIPFQENRFISTASHFLNLEGTGQYVLKAITPLFLGVAVDGNADAGIGVRGTANDVDSIGVGGYNKNGIGVYGESTNDLGLWSSTNNVVNAKFTTFSSNLTNALDLIDIRRNFTGGTPSNNSGSAIVTSLFNIVGTRIKTVFENVATSQIGFEFETKDASASPATKMALNGPGQLKLHKYGETPANFYDPGSLVYNLGVDGIGNVIETTILTNLPAPKVLLKTQDTITGYDLINGILDNTEVPEQFQLTRSPIVTVMDIPQNVIDTYKIYVEMVVHKFNRKGKAFVVPPPYEYDAGTDTGSNALETELGVPLKTRGGLSKVVINPSAPPPLAYDPLRVSRPNHYKVTAMGQNIPVYEYLSGRFTLINQFYNDSISGPIQTQLPIPYYNIGPNRNSASCLQGYSSNFKPLYIAFRYVVWDTTANGGLGEFISGPLSETIAVSSKIFPFIVQTKGSRTYPAGAVPAVLKLHQLFDPTELSCWFVHRR